MSRIGKAPITVPSGVKIEVSADNLVTVNGPKGQLTQLVDRDIEIKLEEGMLNVNRPSDQKRHKALHGLYRSLINNMVIGVTTGYKSQQELVGVGYRASNQGQITILAGSIRRISRTGLCQPLTDRVNPIGASGASTVR